MEWSGVNVVKRIIIHFQFYVVRGMDFHLSHGHAREGLPVRNIPEFMEDSERSGRMRNASPENAACGDYIGSFCFSCHTCI
jgi:hypothetical protein